MQADFALEDDGLFLYSQYKLEKLNRAKAEQEMLRALKKSLEQEVNIFEVYDLKEDALLIKIDSQV